MATTTFTFSPNNQTDAAFRAWGQAVSNALAAIGWTKTTDTGQIDWVTVTRPTVSGSARGHEIWRSNDGGGSLTQYFLKIWYGSSVSNADGMGLWIQFGNATDGASNFVGLSSTQQHCGASNSSGSSTGTLTGYACGAAGRFVIAMPSPGLSISMLIATERTRNPDNSLKNQIHIIDIGNDGGAYNKSHQIFDFVGGASAVQSNAGECLINTTNAIQGSEAGVDLLFGQRGGFTSPSENIFGTNSTIFSPDFGGNAVTIFGAARNYLLIPIAFSLTSNHNRILMRYD